MVQGNRNDTVCILKNGKRDKPTTHFFTEVNPETRLVLVFEIKKDALRTRTFLKMQVGIGGNNRNPSPEELIHRSCFLKKMVIRVGEIGRTKRTNHGFNRCQLSFANHTGAWVYQMKEIINHPQFCKGVKRVQLEGEKGHSTLFTNRCSK